MSPDGCLLEDTHFKETTHKGDEGEKRVVWKFIKIWIKDSFKAYNRLYQRIQLFDMPYEFFSSKT